MCRIWCENKRMYFIYVNMYESLYVMYKCFDLISYENETKWYSAVNNEMQNKRNRCGDLMTRFIAGILESWNVSLTIVWHDSVCHARANVHNSKKDVKKGVLQNRQVLFLSNRRIFGTLRNLLLTIKSCTLYVYSWWILLIFVCHITTISKTFGVIMQKNVQNFDLKVCRNSGLDKNGCINKRIYFSLIYLKWILDC